MRFAAVAGAKPVPIGFQFDMRVFPPVDGIAKAAITAVIAEF
jgi:hypothetical protein